MTGNPPRRFVPAGRWFWGLLLAAAVLAGLYAARGWILPAAALWLDVGQPPQRADYVAVLGGAPDTRPLAAAAIVKGGWARNVLVSHTAPEPLGLSGFLPPEHEVVRRVLLCRGIPASRIGTFGHESATTYDEACGLSAFLQAHPDARLMVVTNAAHTRRARWILRRVLGPAMQRVSMVACPSDGFQARSWWKSEVGVRTIVGENAKMVFYLFRYSWTPYPVVAVLLAAVILLQWRHRTRGGRSQETGVGRRETGVGRRESGVGRRESGYGSRELGDGS